MKDYYEIRERSDFGTLGLVQLKLVSTFSAEREIASIYVHPSEGTVFQLSYPSTKSYGGPETAEALSELLMVAAMRARGIQKPL